MTPIGGTSARFSPSFAIIAAANDIIDDYAADGFSLTLRQLYYQFVARDLIPNKQSEYKRLGSIINDARLAGLIPWDAIEDRTRNLREFPSWDEPADILRSAHASYREDLWADQPFYVEAWIEKDALIGVLESACKKYRIPYFSCRGYVSQSEMWNAPQRMREHADAGKKCVVLHLGDHDPSGVDMTRDISDRLNGFSRVSYTDWTPFPIHVERLALNMDQIRKFNPPPNPAKLTDARAGAYIEQFGDKSWELDALDPKTIASLVHEATEERLDFDAWNASIDQENESRDRLKKLIDEVKS